ncbi:MAG: hypothetical protein AAGA56_28065, partial [Myxococcota bacterium]
MKSRRAWGWWLAGAGVALAACGGEKKEEGGDKAAFEDAAKRLAEPVAVIAVFQPHLKATPPKNKYVPANQGDVVEARVYAADQIRHAANGVRQKLMMSKSAPVKELVAPLTAVASACGEKRYAEEVDKCVVEVEKLDAALAAAETQAKAAGLTSFPRLGPAAVNDAAKAREKAFVDAKGPSPDEAALLAKMEDAGAKPDDVAEACTKAEGQSNTIVASLKGKSDEALEKLAIVHNQKLKGWCVRIKDQNAFLAGIKACEDTMEKDSWLALRGRGRDRDRLRGGVRRVHVDPLARTGRDGRR